MRWNLKLKNLEQYYYVSFAFSIGRVNIAQVKFISSFFSLVSPNSLEPVLSLTRNFRTAKTKAILVFDLILFSTLTLWIVFSAES